MKKEYYIQGDPARAGQIKAAFESKGCEKSNTRDYSNEHWFFFTYKGKVICTDDEVYIDLVKGNPGYTELPLSVEPKFKTGDWVVKKDGKTFYGGNYAEQITLIEVDEKGKRIWLSSTTWTWNDDIRLWTIADAKDGDVLVCYSEAKGSPIEQAGIFKQYVGQHGGCSNTFLAHTGIDWDGNIIINGYMGSTDILPATKEQRDLLFQKMKEAGYTWDGEKKELNKIQTHYDISNFQPKQWVLVRQGDGCAWRLDIFSNLKEGAVCQFECVGNSMVQCIPFDGNTNLLGTTDPCDEFYINW